MFCSRTSNNMINKIHECSLVGILDDKTNSFADVLTKIKPTKTISWIFQTQLFKPMSNLASPKIKNVFTPRVNNFNLKKLQEFATKGNRDSTSRGEGGRSPLMGHISHLKCCLKSVFEKKLPIFSMRGLLPCAIDKLFIEVVIFQETFPAQNNALREKCSNAEFYSGPYFPVFGLNTWLTP